jgi:hypothetical protein
VSLSLGHPQADHIGTGPTSAAVLPAIQAIAPPMPSLSPPLVQAIPSGPTIAHSQALALPAQPLTASSSAVVPIQAPATAHTPVLTAKELWRALLATEEGQEMMRQSRAREAAQSRKRRQELYVPAEDDSDEDEEELPRPKVRPISEFFPSFESSETNSALQNVARQARSLDKRLQFCPRLIRQVSATQASSRN